VGGTHKKLAGGDMKVANWQHAALACSYRRFPTRRGRSKGGHDHLAHVPPGEIGSYIVVSPLYGFGTSICSYRVKPLERA
jgi:hypothetical protein